MLEGRGGVEGWGGGLDESREERVEEKGERGDGRGRGKEREILSCGWVLEQWGQQRLLFYSGFTFRMLVSLL